MLSALQARLIQVGGGPTPRDLIINRFLLYADSRVRAAAVSGIQNTQVEVDNRFVTFASGLLVDNQYVVTNITPSGRDSVIDFTWAK